MRFKKLGASCATLVVALATHQAAMAQGNDADALLGMGIDSLQGELQSRFNDALAASNNSSVINADDPRYLWVIEAKAQCGIAIGYTKSNTKDPVSVSKCVKAHQLMSYIPAPPPPPPPQEARKTKEAKVI